MGRRTREPGGANRARSRSSNVPWRFLSRRGSPACRQGKRKRAAARQPPVRSQLMCRSVLGDDRGRAGEAIIEADLDLGERAAFPQNRSAVRGGQGAVAEVDEVILGLGRPVLAEVEFGA